MVSDYRLFMAAKTGLRSELHPLGSKIKNSSLGRGVFELKKPVRAHSRFSIWLAKEYHPCEWHRSHNYRSLSVTPSSVIHNRWDYGDGRKWSFIRKTCSSWV